MDDKLSNLIAKLSILPGIGERTAQRLAYYILEISDNDAISLGQAIIDAKKNIKFCSICGDFTEVDPCRSCSKLKGIATKIIVCEFPKDAGAIKKTGEFDGTYHILHGVISPLKGVSPENLNIKSLIVRLRNEPNIKEVILATNPTIEGEATASYIASLLKDTGIIVSRISYGVSAGSEIENTDEATLKKAIAGRVKI